MWWLCWPEHESFHNLNLELANYYIHHPPNAAPSIVQSYNEWKFKFIFFFMMYCFN